MNLNDELNNAVDKAEDVANEVKDTAANETQDLAQKAMDAVKAVPEKVKEALDKTDIDEKIVDGAKGIIGKIGSLFGKDKE